MLLVIRYFTKIPLANDKDIYRSNICLVVPHKRLVKSKKIINISP